MHVRVCKAAELVNNSSWRQKEVIYTKDFFINEVDHEIV